QPAHRGVRRAPRGPRTARPRTAGRPASFGAVVRRCDPFDRDRGGGLDPFAVFPAPRPVGGSNVNASAGRTSAAASERWWVMTHGIGRRDRLTIRLLEATDVEPLDLALRAAYRFEQ